MKDNNITEEDGQLSLDIYQNEGEIIILAPVAGIDQKDIKVSVTDDVLMIKGKRQFPLEEEAHKVEAFTEECFWGNFSRSIVLPENVDSTKIEATFDKSVLQIRIPKVEQLRTKVIKVKTK